LPHHLSLLSSRRWNRPDNDRTARTRI
jgi:hypothetical protein